MAQGTFCSVGLSGCAPAYSKTWKSSTEGQARVLELRRVGRCARFCPVHAAQCKRCLQLYFIAALLCCGIAGIDQAHSDAIAATAHPVWLAAISFNTSILDASCFYFHPIAPHPYLLTLLGQASREGDTQVMATCQQWRPALRGDSHHTLLSTLSKCCLTSSGVPQSVCALLALKLARRCCCSVFWLLSTP